MRSCKYVAGLLLAAATVAAPVPKHLQDLPIAPPPRPMSVWVDAYGAHRNYTRDYWDASGVLRRRVHEGDPELQEWRPPSILVPPGVVPEI